jgi:hypothetical protein
MADLFSITAPLLIRYPDDTQDVMVDCLQHSAGLVYFRPFWDRMSLTDGIRLVTGEVRGHGPWKVGDAVVTVLGCRGVHPEQAAEFAEWQVYREQFGSSYPDADALIQFAREAGYYD